MVPPIGAGSSLQASCYLSRQPMGLGGNPPSAVRSAPAGLGQMAATLCGDRMCPEYIQLSKNSLIEQEQRQAHWFMDRLRLRSSFHRLRKRSRSRQPSSINTLQTGPPSGPVIGDLPSAPTARLVISWQATPCTGVANLPVTMTAVAFNRRIPS